MPRLFVGNFDFEHALADPKWRPPARLRRLNDELAFAWLTVAEDGDAIVLPESFEAGFLESAAAAGLPRAIPISSRQLTRPSALRSLPRFLRDWSAVPWGWTSALREEAEVFGLQCEAPRHHDTVQIANSRAFSFKLEREWNVGVAGAEAATSFDAVASCVGTMPPDGRWVVKAGFGMSARERLLGRGPQLSQAAANWLRRRLGSDGVVIFEPWLERLDEAAVQIDVPRGGPPRVLGLTPLLTDASGTYLGSRFDADPALEAVYAPGIEVALRAASETQQLGYFGPLGIDMMRYRDEDGAIRLRPLQDINARWTMGRLALGCRRLLRPGERGEWLHVAWNDPDPQAWFAAFADAQPPGTRLIRTSPFEINGAPTRHGTVVRITPAA